MAAMALDYIGFGHWKVVSGEMKKKKEKIKNPFSTFSEFAFALICNTHTHTHTHKRCGAREEAEVCWKQTTKTLFIRHLTGDHEVPEKRKLIDCNERHLQTQRNFQHSA